MFLFWLEKIGKELGRSDDYYLQLVQAVYHVCQEKIVKQVNEGQEILLQDQYDHIRTSAFKTLITKAFECSSYLSELELSYDVKKRYRENHNALRGIGVNIGLTLRESTLQREESALKRAKKILFDDERIEDRKESSTRRKASTSSDAQREATRRIREENRAKAKAAQKREASTKQTSSNPSSEPKRTKREERVGNKAQTTSQNKSTDENKASNAPIIVSIIIGFIAVFIGYSLESAMPPITIGFILFIASYILLMPLTKK